MPKYSYLVVHDPTIRTIAPLEDPDHEYQHLPMAAHLWFSEDPTISVDCLQRHYGVVISLEGDDLTEDEADRQLDEFLLHKNTEHVSGRIGQPSFVLKARM
jgi:hypothetical protein